LELGELDNCTHYFAGNCGGRNFGGAIHYRHGSLTLSGESTFTRNHVAYTGTYGLGGAVLVNTCNFTLSGTVLFMSNWAQGGGAVYIMNTTVYITKPVNIINNTARLQGGGFAIARSRVIAKAGQLNFRGNSANQGGGMISLNNTSTLVSVYFINNRATHLAGAMFSRGDIIACHNITVTGNTESAISLFRSKLNFSGNANIRRNSGRVGGAITARISIIAFTGSTRFEENSAFASGGAINGGYKATYLFSGYTVFINNKAKCNGGAIHGFIKVVIVFSGVSLFQNNSVDVSGGTMEGGQVVVGSGGAIFASDTHIRLKDMNIFTLNLAQKGGAMYFENGATLDMEPNTTLTTSSNHATKYGGTIFHADSITPSQCQFLLNERTQETILTLPNCFLDLKGLRNNNKSAPFTIQSLNDTAGTDGSFMFGGLTDKCRMFSVEPTKWFVISTAEVVEDVSLWSKTSLILTLLMRYRQNPTLCAFAKMT
jgi:predicted outer membrane repeat protein